MPVQVLGGADPGPRGMLIQALGRPFAPERVCFNYGGDEVLEQTLSWS